ncbi:hypothetical protein CYMTET_10543, partial [Cymbomonas tetramitiformis]
MLLHHQPSGGEKCVAVYFWCKACRVSVRERSMGCAPSTLKRHAGELGDAPLAPPQAPADDAKSKADEQRGVKKKADPAESVHTTMKVGDTANALAQPLAGAGSKTDEQSGVHKADSEAEQVELAKKSLRALLDKDAALPQTLSLGQPEEVAQLLAMLHAALDQDVILAEGQVTQLLGTLFSAAKACTGDAALLARLVCLQRCVHRLLLVTKKLEDGSHLSEEKTLWKQAADKLRRLCVKRFSPTQSHGGTALLELHLSQVQLTLVHLPAHKLSEQMASAAVNVAVGAVTAAFVGSYGTLIKGIGQAAGAGLDAMSQQLSQDCFEQLKELSQRPKLDVKFEGWLRKVHDEHFELGKDGRWEPKGRGRWEPKAAFAAMLADVATAEPSRLSPELLQMVCLGEENFIGLTNLMELGADCSGYVDGVQAGLVNLTVWAQEVLLRSSEEGTTHQSAVPPEQEAPAEAASAANLQESRPPEQPSCNDESWGDEHGLQVLADELERFTIEGMAKLAGAAKQMTTAVAKGLSEHVEDALRGGERGLVKRAKPKAVAALAACDTVLGTVEEGLGGVRAAADALQPLAQLASKFLRAFVTLSEPAGLVKGAIEQALYELDQLPRRLEERLAAALSEAGFAERLHNMVAALLGRSSASESAPSRQAARPGTSDSEGAGPSEETAKDSIAGLLCDAVLPEVDSLRVRLSALQGLLGLPKMAEERGAIRRELTELLMQLQGTVALATRSEVERCMPEDAAVLEAGEVESLAKRLQETLPAVVSRMVSKRVAQMTALVGERRGASPPSGEVAPRLHEVIVRVDAGLATLQQAHARLSGKSPDRAGNWFSSLIPGGQKGETARDDGAVADGLGEDPARVWQRLWRALGGLDWILCRITATECATGWSPQESEAMWEDTISLALQAEAGSPRELPALAPGSTSLSRRGTQKWANMGTAQRFVTSVQSNLGQRASGEVTAAFLQLSLLLAQARALVRSLRGASQGLALRGLVPLDAAKKGVTDAAHNVIKAMTVVAREQLESLAEGCTDSLGDAATSALSDTCGALVAPALGLLGEAARGRKSRRASEFWQVREVAVVSGLRVLDALRDEAAGATRRTAPAETLASFRAVRKELQSAVLVRFSLERAPSLKALQRNGEALAAELNAPLRVVPAPGETRTASVTRAAADSGILEELLKALDEERGRCAAREERKKLAAAEQHAAWVEAQALLKQTLEAQLRELEEAQKAAEREPDLLKKQLLLVRCRDMHAALAQSSRNVEDIGTAVGVLAGFLTTVNDKLDVVNESLNKLQSSVRELGADLRRMVGRPVLEELRERARALHEERGSRLSEGVHITIEGVGAGDDGKFLVSDENKPFELLEAVRERLLESEEKNLLLLSGPAGSGKSTFVRTLERFVENHFVRRCSDRGLEAVLVKASLPTLKNPMADLFHEALRQQGLREAQIHELRDLARAGKVALVFLLDAYDELPMQCLFKNLYMSNNLEQYRCQPGPAAPAEGSSPAEPSRTQGAGGEPNGKGGLPLYPKVIITTRTELLSRAAEYHHAFVPMETDEPARATVEAARAAFLELRIAPFGSKVDAYIHAKVALEVRRELDRQVGALAPLSKEAAEALRAGAGALWRHDALKEGSGGELLDAACAAVTAPGGLSESLERVTRYMQQVPHDLLALQFLPSWPVVWALAGALAETPLGLEQALKSFCEGLARAETGKIWLHRDYRDAFDAIPELKELTTTPFMVEIVMEILPKLQELQSTDASMKAKLLLLLEQDAAQMVWGCISRWRGPGNSVLLQLQAALKGGSDVAPAQGLESLKKLEDEVVGMLKGQGLVLNQPKLVALGWEQLQATGVAFGQRPRRGGSDGNTAACDVSMDDQAGPEAQVDWILDEVVEDVIQEEEEEEKDRLLEDIICQVGILYVLKNALCRQKVQGSHIYAMFMYMFVQREARKAVTQGAYDADTVEREGAQYAQRLALTMVAENVTKVPLRSDSELFHEESIWDPFLRGGGELRATVQKAAPVRCEGGMLTFIHKTVQEYLCAASLRANLRQILHASAVPLEELTEELLQQELMARHGDAPQPVGAVTQRGVKGSKEWAQVDLRHEDVVRDFLVDLFLEDVEFISEAAFVVAWAERCCKGGYLSGAGGHACDLLLNNRDDEGRTPLFCAAQSGHAQVAAALLAAGARRDARSKLRPEDASVDLSHADNYGRTPAHEAAGGKEAAARALLEVGAGVNSGTGRRPLHAAAEKGLVEMVRELVGKDAEVDAEDGEGRTALTVALAFGQEGAARALLEVGAGVNAGTGQRAVHAAAEKGLEEAVRLLAGKGAEVDAEDGEGRTALTVALAFGQEAVARALLEAGAGVNAGTGRRPFHAAAEKGMVEMVRELAGKGAEVDAEDGEGRTALTVALAFGQEAAARALLEAGAGVNAGTGQRPLHAAAMKGMEEMVRELAAKGAEVDAEDGEGRTALTVALAFGQE